MKTARTASPYSCWFSKGKQVLLALVSGGLRARNYLRCFSNKYVENNEWNNVLLKTRGRIKLRKRKMATKLVTSDHRGFVTVVAGRGR